MTGPGSETQTSVLALVALIALSLFACGTPWTYTGRIVGVIMSLSCSIRGLIWER